MSRTLNTIVRTANPVARVKLMAAPDALHINTAADDQRRVVHGRELPTHSSDAFGASYAECESQGAREADPGAEFGYANPPFGRRHWRCELWMDDRRNTNGRRSADRRRLHNERRIASICP